MNKKCINQKNENSINQNVRNFLISINAPTGSPTQSKLHIQKRFNQPIQDHLRLACTTTTRHQGQRYATSSADYQAAWTRAVVCCIIFGRYELASSTLKSFIGKHDVVYVSLMVTGLSESFRSSTWTSGNASVSRARRCNEALRCFVPFWLVVLWLLTFLLILDVLYWKPAKRN